MRILLIISLLSLFSGFSFAGHLVGGEMTYEHVGGDTYVIQLIMYRDCYAGPNWAQDFDDTVNIAAYSGGNNSQLIDFFRIRRPDETTRLPLVLQIPCLPDPPDLCIRQITYRDTIIIDVPANGLYLINERCCRTPHMENVVFPQANGASYAVFIPGQNSFQNNSSPKFNVVPPIGLCAGIHLTLDYSATDPDGDSLSYHFCTPYDGEGLGYIPNTNIPDTPSAPPIDTISWTSGFNRWYQIPSDPAFQIDENTGLITGRPNKLGTFAFAVCVREYREGQFLSENRRDFQMTVTSCDVEAAAAIDSAIEECIGREIQFYNASSLGEYFTWDFGDPNTIADTSSKENPSYTYPDTGTYTIRLIAKGEAGCADTSFFDYHVRPKIIPAFEQPASSCFENHSIDLIPSGYYRDETLITWIINGDTLEQNLLENDSGIFDLTFEKPGGYPVTLIYRDYGCVKTHKSIIGLHPNPTFELLNPAQTQCSPFEGMFRTYSTNAWLPSYEWYVDGMLTSTDSTPTIKISEPGYHDLEVRMTTDSLCVDSLSEFREQHIQVLGSPNSAFQVSPSEVTLFEPHVDITDGSLDAKSVQYFLDGQPYTTDRIFSLELNDTGTFEILQIVEHASGCLDSTTKTFKVYPEFNVFAPNSFSPDGDGINEFWFPAIESYAHAEVIIYDRWGHAVFQTNNPSEGWNGRINNTGEKCPVGTYSYTIYAISERMEEQRHVGRIILFR